MKLDFWSNILFLLHISVWDPAVSVWIRGRVRQVWMMYFMHMDVAAYWTSSLTWGQDMAVFPHHCLAKCLLVLRTDNIFGPFKLNSSDSSWNPKQHTGVSSCISRMSHYFVTNWLLIIVIGLHAVCISAPKARVRTWDLVCFCSGLNMSIPVTLCFLGCVHLPVLQPSEQINDWRTHVFSCQLRRTFGTELRVSAPVLTASSCFKQS